MFDFILTNLASFIVPAIILSAVIGILSFFGAIGGVCRESNLLKEVQKKQEQGQSLLGSGSDRKMRIAQLEFWISREEAKRKSKRELRVGDGRHLLMRLKTIYESVTQTSAAEIPSLHDLHILTQQDEMSRFSSGCLRTITSFLLIMGILGTLTGVHHVVTNDSFIEISELGNALEPSMFAVFFTIILMWIRGGYIALLNSYLEKLDLYTITEIIPRLQPVSNLGGHTADLGQILERLEEKIRSVTEMSTLMEEINTDVSNEVTKVEKLVLKAESVCSELKNAQTELEEIKSTSADCLKKMDATLATGAQTAEKIESDTLALKTKASELQEECTTVSSQYEVLNNHLRTSAKTMANAQKTLALLKEDAQHMAKVGVQIEKYKEHVENLENNTRAAKQTLAEIESLRNEIQESENITEDSAQTSELVRAEAEGYLNALRAENNNFRQMVEANNIEVNLKMEELTEQVNELITAAKNIERAEAKRAKRIGVTLGSGS